MKKMKKLIIVFSVILTTAMGFAQETETSKKEAVQKTVYTCPHHKKMTSNMPGKCSKCQMDLVEVSTLKLELTELLFPARSFA